MEANVEEGWVHTCVGPVSMWIHSVWGGVLACAAHTPHSDVPWDPGSQLGGSPDVMGDL